MRYRNILALLPILLLTLAGAAAPASAQPDYGPTRDALEVSATQVAVGEPVTVTGGGFEPKTEVTVTVNQSAQALGLTGSGRGALFAAAPLAWFAPMAVWGTVTADSNGVATARVKLSEPGTWIIRLRGPDAAGGERMLSTTVVVSGSESQAGSTGQELTKTGVDLTFLWAGLGLLVAGGALVALARGRRRVRI